MISKIGAEMLFIALFMMMETYSIKKILLAILQQLERRP